jgi:hypothetical protein
VRAAQVPNARQAPPSSSASPIESHTSALAIVMANPPRGTGAALARAVLDWCLIRRRRKTRPEPAAVRGPTGRG